MAPFGPLSLRERVRVRAESPSGAALAPGADRTLVAPKGRGDGSRRSSMSLKESRSSLE